MTCLSWKVKNSRVQCLTIVMSFVLEVGKLHLWRLQKCRGALKSSWFFIMEGEIMNKILTNASSLGSTGDKDLLVLMSVADSIGLEIRFPMFLHLLPSCYINITIPYPCLLWVFLTFSSLQIKSMTKKKILIKCVNLK